MQTARASNLPMPARRNRPARQVATYERSPLGTMKPSLELGARLDVALWNNRRRASAHQRCLSHIVAVLEPQITPIAVKESLPEDENFDDLTFNNCMAELGYHANTMRLAPADIDPRLLPCVFKPDDAGSSPLVVLSLADADGQSRCTAYDGNTGDICEIAPDSGRLEKVGTCTFFRKKSATDLSTSKKVRADTNRTWIGATFARFSPHVWKLIAMGVLLNVIALATPLFVMIVYDRVISPRSTEALPMLMVGAGLALALELGIRMQRTRLLSWMTARIHYIVGTEVFKRLFELPPAVIQQASLTAQIARRRSFESVRDFFSGPIFASTIELPSVIVSVAVLMFFSLELALVPIAAACVFTAAFFIQRHFIGTAIKIAASEASVAQRFCAEALQDREEIRANGLVDIWKQKFREISGRENAAYARLHYLSAVGEHSAYAITILTGLGALLLGVHLVWAGALTTGMLVASMILVWRAISPFANVCSQIARFEQFRNSTRQINMLMDVETEDEVRNVSSRLPQLQGAVELQNIALRYSREASPLFHGVNLRVAPGEAVAICGAMGTGKSCLLRLIQCMHNPHVGKILVDNLNIQQLDARELRRQISFIPQTPQAYPGTIAENIRIVSPEVSDEVVWQALDRAGAATLVRAMPHGLEQPIQSCRHDHELLLRLAFARHYVRNARIILIDEIAANSVNNGMQRLVGELIESARGRQTVFFVSQRVDQLRMADKVIGLRHGKAPIIGSLDKVLEATS